MRPYQNKRASLTLVLISISFFQATSVCAQTQHPKQLVEVVEVQGNRRLSDKDILAYLKTRPGEPFSERRIQRDLQMIIKSGVFDKTLTRVITQQGARGGVEVIFEVLELPLILEVKFKGLEIAGIEESEVVNALRENRVNLFKGEVSDRDKVRAALHVIQTLLASRGRENIRVEAHEKVDSATEVSIEFSFAYAGQ
ncbi:MAG TPA: POTRA domain-containing protein [Pyrinomonadaceae bacterium]|nr:POTRA domain-containing protein [Pyrinomonadaceae bacterium]